ncbi:MAG: hypothetical protein ABUT20_21545 [Bacteroidota bacterium]
MFLEEKIDRLKREFSPSDFSVPFIEGSSILKSIETEFIVVKDLTKDQNNLRQYHNNWPENIKRKMQVKSLGLNNYTVWLDRLDSNTNYWTVIINRNLQSQKHLVYDCKPNAIVALLSIMQDDFFIVDKKYKWFSYFQINKQTHQVTLFRSGEKVTPFEV